MPPPARAAKSLNFQQTSNIRGGRLKSAAPFCNGSLFALAQDNGVVCGVFAKREQPHFLLPRVFVVFGLVDADLVFVDLAGSLVILGHDVAGEAVGLRHPIACVLYVDGVAIAPRSELYGAAFIEAAVRVE